MNGLRLPNRTNRTPRRARHRALPARILTAAVTLTALGCSQFTAFRGSSETSGLNPATQATLPDAAGKSDALGRRLPATVETPVVPAEARRDPKKSQANIQIAIGQMHESRDDLAHAQLAYEEALRSDPTSLAAALALAHLYQQTGRSDTAVTVYQDTLKQHRKDASVWNDFGLCLAEQKRWPEAIGALRKAVELDSRRTLYRNNLGMVLAGAGKLDEAWKEFREAVGPAPAHYNIAVMLTREGKTAQAREHLERAITIMPAFSDAKELLAKCNDPTRADLANAPELPLTPSTVPLTTSLGSNPVDKLSQAPTTVNLPEPSHRSEDSDPWARRWVAPQWTR